MLLDDVLEDIPDLWACALDHALSTLDVVRSARSDELLHDKRLEELECHDFRQAALMQLEFRADDDNGTARIVDALAEQVLAEAALFALEHVGERLERAVARARDRTAATAVIDQGVDSLLQHALLVAHDDVRRTEVQEALEAVVAVDDAAVEIVEVGRREAATVKLYHWAQVWRDDWDDVEDHPRRLVARLAECLDNFEAADSADLLLAGSRADFLAQDLAHAVEVELLEELLDGLGAHADAEGIAVFLERFMVVLL